MIRELPGAGLHGPNVEPEFFQPLFDELLRRLLVPEQARHPHELLEKGDRLGQSVLDGAARIGR